MLGLEGLAGIWYDDQDSIYALSLRDEGSIDVRTERPSGEIKETTSLIRVLTSCDVKDIVFGSGNLSSLYHLVNHVDESLTWRRSGSKDFVWHRKSASDFFAAWTPEAAESPEAAEAAEASEPAAGSRYLSLGEFMKRKRKAEATEVAEAAVAAEAASGFAAPSAGAPRYLSLPEFLRCKRKAKYEWEFA